MTIKRIENVLDGTGVVRETLIKPVQFDGTTDHVTLDEWRGLYTVMAKTQTSS